MEIKYREIPGKPGYRAGTDGSIWSCINNRWGKSGEWKQLKPSANNRYGRKIIRMGRGTCRYLHHVILETFVGPRPKGMEALHINGDAFDNAVSNLRWGTREENLADFRAHGRKKGQKHHRAVLTDAKIIQIRALAAQGKTHQLIADTFGVRREAVSKIVRRERWTHI